MSCFRFGLFLPLIFIVFPFLSGSGTSKHCILSPEEMEKLVCQLEEQLKPIRDGLKVSETLEEGQTNDDYKEKFKQEVIDAYLPSARVLFKQLLPRLDAKHLRDAYEAIIEVFDSKPWYYFLNSSKGFDGRFLFSINDELTVYYRFLKDYLVETGTGKLFAQKDVRGGGFTTVKNYWSEKLGVETYFRFHALICDYGFIKLYGFAMRLVPDAEATKNFVSTYGRLYQIVSMLSGSSYERQYQESIKAAQRIMKLMESRIHPQDDAYDSRALIGRMM